MYSTYGQNPYLNTSLLSQQFSEAMKAQERHAIKAILAAKKSKIKSKGVTVSEKLTMQTSKNEKICRTDGGVKSERRTDRSVCPSSRTPVDFSSL